MQSTWPLLHQQTDILPDMSLSELIKLLNGESPRGTECTVSGIQQLRHYVIMEVPCLRMDVIKKCCNTGIWAAGSLKILQH